MTRFSKLVPTVAFVLLSRACDAAIVERNLDDYYYSSEGTQKYNCPHANWSQINEQGLDATNKDDHAITFRKQLEGAEDGSATIKDALLNFLFSDEDYSILKLIENNKLSDLANKDCKSKENWHLLRSSADDTKNYQCQDCGFKTEPAHRQAIVDFVNRESDETDITTESIPEYWCHNPLPQKMVTEHIGGELWGKTGGYYSILKCNATPYSVIGFAGEGNGTCYPFHTHKSYELYWPFAGNASWRAWQRPQVYDSYEGNGGKTYSLHKHDPTHPHEITTLPTESTTQIYFWSMTGTDVFTPGVNNYDAAIWGKALKHTSAQSWDLTKEEQGFLISSCWSQSTEGKKIICQNAEKGHLSTDECTDYITHKKAENPSSSTLYSDHVQQSLSDSS